MLERLSGKAPLLSRYRNLDRLCKAVVDSGVSMIFLIIKHESPGRQNYLDVFKNVGTAPHSNGMPLAQVASVNPKTKRSIVQAFSNRQQMTPRTKYLQVL